jgi:hypothetical protein
VANAALVAHFKDSGPLREHALVQRIERILQFGFLERGKRGHRQLVHRLFTANVGNPVLCSAHD